MSPVGHFLEYAILGVLLSVSFGIKKEHILPVILAASLYGVSDELHQFFVPGRVASVYDVATDVAGSAVGSFSAFLLKHRL
jgi:VanZ family protein